MSGLHTYKELPEWLTDFIDRNTWTFAKTMPNNPHEWLALQDIQNQHDDFRKAVDYIREYGYELIFGRRSYTCLNYDGRRYWTMDKDIRKVVLINRALND